MKQKILLLFFSILLSSSYLQAQKETYWWYFGYNAGMTFSTLQTLTAASGTTVSGLPTRLNNSPIYTAEGCFSISDRDGNFLFASDGQTVYNRNLAVMANGTGLHGDPSSTQSGIIVPRPGSNNEFYLIVSPVYSNRTSGLTYSLIDISANGGDGAVSSTIKNRKIQLTGTGLTEANVIENAAVVGHSDGVNYWLISRMHTKFVVWEITNTGFSDPQSYEAGYNASVHPIVNFAGAGEIRISPKGDKVIHADYMDGGGFLSYGDFDPSTGVITNTGYVNTGIGRCYGAEFSPSGEYLFITSVDAGASNGLYVKKVSELHLLPYTRIDTNVANVQQSFDGRIYGIAKDHTSLWVILNPDEGGTDIQRFDNFFIWPRRPHIGLPNFIASFFSVSDVETSPALPVCVNNSVSFTIRINAGTGPNKVAKVVWDFGDGSILEEDTDMTQATLTHTHTYTKARKYRLTITPYNSIGEVLTEKIKTMEVPISRCVIPVNHNISLFY